MYRQGISIPSYRNIINGYVSVLTRPENAVYFFREVLGCGIQKRPPLQQHPDFALKKGLEHLGVVRDRFLAISDRFAGYQAQWSSVHVDFPLFQRLALPLQVGTAKFPGIKIQDTRMIRLMEILLHGGAQVAGWRATQIHQAVLSRFHLSANGYGAQSTPLSPA